MTDNPSKPKWRRLDPEVRRKIVLNAAVKLARENRVEGFTQQDVADACEVETTRETVKRYFPTIADLRKAAQSELKK